MNDLHTMLDDLRKIPLTQGYSAVVDAADYTWLSAWKWHAHITKRRVYAKRSETVNGKRVTTLMHRQILNVSPEIQIDHKDGDGLNNRRSNLRPASNQQNCHNARGYQGKGSSKYKGVSWDKNRRKWGAYIRVGGKVRNLGRFDSEMEAARVYDAAASAHFGEFAYLNLGGHQ